jgi:hypothetical protein
LTSDTCHSRLTDTLPPDLQIDVAVPKALIDRNLNDLHEAYLKKNSIYRQLRDSLFDPAFTELDQKLRDVPLQMQDSMRDLMYSLTEELSKPLEQLEREFTNPDVSESEQLEDRFLQASAHEFALGEERVRIRNPIDDADEGVDQDVLAEDVDEDVEEEEDIDEEDTVDIAEERAKLEKIEQILKNLTKK